MRIATAVLIILAGLTVVHAQQLERPSSFYPAQMEKSLRPLFPTAPQPGSPLPSLPIPRAERQDMPLVAAPQPVTPPRSGMVGLREVPVDPSVDRGFPLAVPDTRSHTMRIIPVPPCVTAAPQPRP